MRTLTYYQLKKYDNYNCKENTYDYENADNGISFFVEYF